MVTVLVTLVLVTLRRCSCLQECEGWGGGGGGGVTPESFITDLSERRKSNLAHRGSLGILLFSKD